MADHADHRHRPAGPSSRQDVLDIMVLGLRAGEVMLESSVATSDVEAAVRRLTTAFGLPECEVTVTLNVLTMGYLGPALSDPVTLVRVVELGEPRLHTLVELEALAREAETGALTVTQAGLRVNEIDATEPPHGRITRGLAGLVSAAAWVVFAAGGVFAAVAGVVAALSVAPIRALTVRTRVPAAFEFYLSAVVVVAAPHAFWWAGAPIALAPAIAGGLYPLLPGGALVAAVQDGLSGAPLSSLAKALDVIVTAVAIALGVLSALAVVSALEITGTPDLRAVPTWAVTTAGVVAVAGLAVQRGMPRSALGPTAVLALAAWAVTSIAPERGVGRTMAVFLAAAVIGLGGQVAARLQGSAATIYIGSAVYVLVPGLTVYLAMVAFAHGDSDLGTDLTLRAIKSAGAIAAGVALGSALGREAPAVRRPRYGPSPASRR